MAEKKDTKGAVEKATVEEVAVEGEPVNSMEALYNNDLANIPHFTADDFVKISKDVRRSSMYDIPVTEPYKRVINLPDGYRPGDPSWVFPKELYSKFFYGNKLNNGLVEVRVIAPRDPVNPNSKLFDDVLWYERPVVVDNNITAIAYHVKHSPNDWELFDEYYYCATQWNISQKRLADQDNVPTWKVMASVDTNIGGRQVPYIVSAQGRAAGPLQAYHFVIINKRWIPKYVTNERGQQVEIDGQFVLSRPVSGAYIRQYNESVVSFGGTPEGAMRIRASETGDGMISI